MTTVNHKESLYDYFIESQSNNANPVTLALLKLGGRIACGQPLRVKSIDVESVQRGQLEAAVEFQSSIRKPAPMDLYVPAAGVAKPGGWI